MPEPKVHYVRPPEPADDAPPVQRWSRLAVWGFALSLASLAFAIMGVGVAALILSYLGGFSERTRGLRGRRLGQAGAVIAIASFPLIPLSFPLTLWVVFDVLDLVTGRGLGVMPSLAEWYGIFFP